MTDTSKQLLAGLVAYRGALAVLSAATVLSACVVQERVYRPPPPPRVYAPPPPPPQYADPAPEVEVQVAEAPPPLPDYDQPACPEDGYLWTPGYWHWTGSDYYWVPGTWVQPPRVGVLWTPGYWGFVGGMYGWHAGYWGPHVGFYGGVNYGFGYVGVGFVGGRWAGNSFAYNRNVVNVNTTVIHNTYNETVVNNVTINKVSYNGGAGGIAVAPTAQERIAAHDQHVAPTFTQREHVAQAIQNPGLAARVNAGHPAIAATARPAAFSGPGVIGARGAQPINAAHTQASPRQPYLPQGNADQQPGGGRSGTPPATMARPGAAAYGAQPIAGRPNLPQPAPAPRAQAQAQAQAVKPNPPAQRTLAPRPHPPEKKRGEHEGGNNR